ncbi:unknown [Bacteroides sp. CAG:714]|jgi:hypothetical protein|nr:unknown [Bacteroides sp. CAG:714]
MKKKESLTQYPESWKIIAVVLAASLLVFTVFVL